MVRIWLRRVSRNFRSKTHPKFKPAPSQKIAGHNGIPESAANRLLRTGKLGSGDGNSANGATLGTGTFEATSKFSDRTYNKLGVAHHSLLTIIETSFDQNSYTNCYCTCGVTSKRQEFRCTQTLSLPQLDGCSRQDLQRWQVPPRGVCVPDCYEQQQRKGGQRVDTNGTRKTGCL